MRRLISIFLPLSAAAMDVPLHANATASGWTCHAGYYRTTPTVLGASPTCRPCSPPTLPCSAGTRLVACISDADAQCVPCPQPPNGHAYVTGGGCNATVCIAGWTHYDVDQCVPCPLGFYCPLQGQQTRCGDGCTTAAPGATQSLQCVLDAGGTQVLFAIQCMFVAPAFGGPSLDTACLPLQTLVQGWLPYDGVYQGLSLRLLSSTLGAMTYTVGAPRCIVGDFLAWLMPTILQRHAENADRLLNAIAACTGAPLSLLVVGAPVVQPSGERNFSSSLAAPPHPPRSTTWLLEEAPPLIIERRRWGQSRFENELTLAVVVAMLCGLCVGLSAACALACTRARRRSLARSLFHHLNHARRRLLRRMARIKIDNAPPIQQHHHNAERSSSSKTPPP